MPGSRRSSSGDPVPIDPPTLKRKDKFFLIRTRQRRNEDRGLVENFDLGDLDDDENRNSLIFYQLFLRSSDSPLDDRDVFHVVQERDPSRLQRVNDVAREAEERPQLGTEATGSQIREKVKSGIRRAKFLDVMYPPLYPIVRLGFRLTEQTTENYAAVSNRFW
jgi:hypothetical protein